MNDLYFAYGSNLDSVDRNRKIPPDTLRAIGRARLFDHQLCFGYYSPGRGGGALTLSQQKGWVVDGVLFDCPGEGRERLDRKEGAGAFYDPIRVFVQCPRGEWLDAFTYVACEHRREEFVPPTREYVEIVTRGCAEHGISPAPVVRAARNQPNPPASDALFVYGSLMRGEQRAELLQQIECVLLACTFGRLYDLGEHPGMRSTRGEELVQGDFVRVKDIHRTLELLDRIEGFQGPASTENLFRRELVRVDAGDGRIRRAWTYLYDHEPSEASRIQSGDWREHKGTRTSFLQALVRAHCGDREPEIARSLSERIPWAFNPGALRHLLPLWQALERGELSERRLAQESDRWDVVPGLTRGLPGGLS
ncbi:hypothetical protein DYH09_04265 [bacterium CPR1]|nr:hypothetical protein [bacterium CPR1]